MRHLKLCRFLPEKIFDEKGGLVSTKENFINQLKKYLLVPKNTSSEKVAQAALEDLVAKGTAAQKYLDLVSPALSLCGGLAPRVLGMYLNPNKVYTGFLNDDGKIIRTKNTIPEIMGGEALNLMRSYSPADITFLSPVDVADFFVLANNYREPTMPNTGYKENPLLLYKAPSAIIGAGHPLFLSHQHLEEKPTPECELAVYCRKPLKDMTSQQIMRLIESEQIGITICNDFTIQGPAGKCLLEINRGKSQYSFAPLGPYLEIGFDNKKVLDWRFYLSVNGVIKQEGEVKNYVFGIAETLSFLSQNIDTRGPFLVSMGTTPLNIQEVKFGDKIYCNVESLGELINPIVVR